MSISAVEKFVGIMLFSLAITILYFMFIGRVEVQYDRTFEVGRPIGKDLSRALYQAGNNWSTYTVDYEFKTYFVTEKDGVITAIKRMD